MIRKSFDPVHVTPTAVTSGVEVKYRKTYDEHGNAIYTQHGEINIASYVTSFESGCTLESILQRCTYMPLNDKVNYLQQTAPGTSVDFSDVPTDLTDAFIRCRRLSQQNPAIFKRLRSGEDPLTIIKSLIEASKPSDSNNNKINNNESEVTNNG